MPGLRGESLSFLKDYLARFRDSILLGAFFKLLEAVLELAIPMVMAALIDEGAALQNSAVIWRKAGLMAVLAVIGVLCALVCQVVATRASTRFGQALRHDAFQKMGALSQQDVDHLGGTSLVTRLTADVSTLEEGLAMLIRLVPRAPFLTVGSIVMAVVLDVELSAVFLVTTPLIVLSMYLVLRMTAPRYARLQKLLDKVGLVTRETLAGTRVIRAFSREKEMCRTFRDAAQRYTGEALRAGRLSALLSPATAVIMNMGILGVLMLGAKRVDAGAVKVGVVIAFMEYLAQILLQTGIVANLVMLYTRAGASARRLGELMDMAPAVRDVRWSDKPAPDSREALGFNHVSLVYPDGKQALRDITFSLKKGETLGIIGGTGSGKSSVAALMLRGYDATEGTVSVGGRPVKEMPLKELRRRVSIVPQRAALLAGTVRDNLALGDGTLTDRTLEKALRLAQAAFVFDEKEGLDTVVEEGGRNFSGGQRQRLTIARALARSSDITVLDDAFSALDFATERALRRALHSAQEGRSLVLISQRVSTIRHADQILVLDEGCMAGLGTHEQLMQSCPVYREIWQSQIREERP